MNHLFTLKGKRLTFSLAAASALIAFNSAAQSPPIVSVESTSKIVLDGGGVLFRITVTGSEPLTYQWQLNGTNLPYDLVITAAGDGTTNRWRDGELATEASINRPLGVTLDHRGLLYIADSSNNRVRRIDSYGIITTIAGNGIAGYSGDGGSATNASLSTPAGLVFDSLGNLSISDYSNHRIRKVDTNGFINSVVGGDILGISWLGRSNQGKSF